MANIYRDVTLQNVSENDIGKQMKVSGWVENIRDHGGVSFIDLRDMYGVLQVVIREPELLKGIKKEECISIDGVMEQRDEETYNPKIPSGTIELEAKKITVLGQVYQQVPFEIQTSKEVRVCSSSNSGDLVVISPNTTFLSPVTFLSGSNPPERSSSYSR